MKIRSLIVGTVILLGLTALACTSKTTVVSPDQQSPGVTVSGSGSVFGTPDVAVVTLGVDAQAASVGDARTQAAQHMDAMLKAFTDGGVDKKDIQTTRFNVQPIYDFPNGRQVLRGFIVSNVATVKIRKIDDTGALVDAAIAAGGDLSRVESLSFTIDDPTTLGEQARTKAVEDAKNRAQTLAQSAGVELGTPRSIVESPAPVIPVDFKGAQALPAAEAPTTPVQVGQLEVKVDVQVVYGLK